MGNHSSKKKLIHTPSDAFCVAFARAVDDEYPAVKHNLSCSCYTNKIYDALKVNRGRVLAKFASYVEGKFTQREIVDDVFRQGDPFERVYSDPLWRATVKRVFLNADMLLE